MRAHHRIVASLAVAVCTALPFMSHAGAIKTIDCNIDAYNLTGRTANDFDIVLRGVSKAEVNRLYQNTRYFPNVDVTDIFIKNDPNDPGILIHYWGKEVRAFTDPVHIGYEISPSGPIGTVDQYWSWNGDRLGGPEFRCNLPTTHVDGSVTNPGTAPAWVQRRVAYQSGPVDLVDDLVLGSTLWANAQVIDQSFVEIAGDTSLPYTFADQGHGAYVMMYDVCADMACTGGRVQTVFNAVYYTPEPSSLALLVAGLAGLAVRARRNRGRKRRDTARPQ